MTEDSIKTSRLAIASFFLSLASVVLGPFGFIPGIVCGHLARRRVARDATLDDPGFAKAGLVIGYVFVALSALLMAAAALYALGAFVLDNQRKDHDTGTAQTDLVILTTYLEDYHEFVGAYPTTEQGLSALTRRPVLDPVPENWRYFLGPRYFTDPWGRPYHYRCPGIRNPNSYDVWCLGPDGEAGTEDDLIGW
jgi:general secretion pathway protein G